MQKSGFWVHQLWNWKQEPEMSFQQIAKYRACQEEEDGRTEDLLLKFFFFHKKIRDSPGNAIELY